MQVNMKKVEGSITFKLGFIVVLVILLIIPVEMVRSLVGERLDRRNDTVEELNRTWGGSQTVGGLILSVPYQYTRHEGGAKTTEESAMIFLPETVDMRAEVQSEIRNRGIFQIPVFTAKVHLSGQFNLKSFIPFEKRDLAILWAQAQVSVILAKPRALRDQVVLHWGEQDIKLGPQTLNLHLAQNLLQANLPLSDPAEQTVQVPFSLDLNFAGSESLRFIPLGERTQVQLKADWSNPSFQGSYLPSKHQISQNGFDAQWQVLAMGRDFPQSWEMRQAANFHLSNSAMGVDFMLPVDVYQKSERATKYAILFIAFTFIGYFLFEVIYGLRMHPFQYITIGCALVLFYLMLLSLTEHLPFHWAYWSASLAISALISGYSWSILGQRRRALIVAGELLLIYGFLYLLLRSSDFALLLGSLGLFIALALIMYLTRNIDWYQPAEKPAAIPSPNP